MKVVLFSGGSGTRLWPLSRPANPKQFQPLIGSDSLFQLMVRRLARGFGRENIFVSTGEVYRDLVRVQSPEIPAENIIAEPEMRDTLAAVGYAATVLDQRFPNCTLATLWGADHIIRQEQEFLKALTIARDLAVTRGWIVKVDLRPTFPSTALGYIEVGERLTHVDDLEVRSFVRQIEKPDRETAEEFITSPKYLWNSGYIVWTTGRILELYRSLAPEAFGPLQAIRAALGTPEERTTVAAEYAKIPGLSVDYGIFQKMGGEDIVVIPADFGWSDVGAWNVLRDELMETEGEGNVVQGKHISIDTRRTLVYGPADKVIVTIGLVDFVVVDTEDALLICPASRAQEVKKVVERLQEEGPEFVR